MKPIAAYWATLPKPWIDASLPLGSMPRCFIASRMV